MRALIFLMVLLLAACKGGGGGSDAPPRRLCERAGGCVSVTLFMGGCPGATATDSTIKSPEVIDTRQPPSVYEPKFAPLGDGLKQYANVRPRNSLGSSCQALEEHRINLRVNLVADGRLQSERSGFDCVLTADLARTDQEWGHELWHCIDGSFHP